MTVTISLETLEARKKWRIFQALKELTMYKSVSSKNIFQELRWNKDILRFYTESSNGKLNI